MPFPLESRSAEESQNKPSGFAFVHVPRQNTVNALPSRFPKRLPWHNLPVALERTRNFTGTDRLRNKPGVHRSRQVLLRLLSQYKGLQGALISFKAR